MPIDKCNVKKCFKASIVRRTRTMRLAINTWSIQALCVYWSYYKCTSRSLSWTSTSGFSQSRIYCSYENSEQITNRTKCRYIILYIFIFVHVKHICWKLSSGGEKDRFQGVECGQSDAVAATPDRPRPLHLHIYSPSHTFYSQLVSPAHHTKPVCSHTSHITIILYISACNYY